MKAFVDYILQYGNLNHHLINLPKGQRPLRTVVDPSTGEFVQNANNAVSAEYAKALTAFNMQELLA